MTAEKLARSRFRSATIGFRKGPTAWRTPVDMKVVTEKAPTTHQP